MAAPISLYRHTLATRLMHWLNALCIFVMLMSGLQIFNAHPRLYWGQYGANADHAALELSAKDLPDGRSRGVLRLGHHEISTNGFLGVSEDASGDAIERGFPRWATLPSYQDLATGRRWHFFFAWVLVINSALYFLISFVSRHVQRDLLPTRTQWTPTNIVRDFWDHLRLRLPKGDAARTYNSLQKLAYLVILFIVAPLILATGLTMSPGFDAGYPWLLDLFGGRQSARTLHFICAMAVVLFGIIHVGMVLLAGPFNEIRSMITGRYVLPKERAK
ncbi:MAG TPA: cytochrome b/b6 domain-containing protein [Rhizomicrobium sp.]|nr:cytochrome b/b6 domain-containing protein [Rhizomicrobium sp.]